MKGASRSAERTEFTFLQFAPPTFFPPDPADHGRNSERRFVMNRLLPPNPSLDWLRHRAKDLRKAHRARNPETCETLRHLQRFASASNEKILAADVTLHDVQLALALEYGFPNWNAMKTHIENLAATKAPDGAASELTSSSVGPSRVKTEGHRLWIDGVPKLAWGRSGSCTYVGALEAALAPTAHPFSYTDLMGLSGLAFRVRWYRRTDVAGWCPSSAVGEFPAEERAIADATGWTFRNINHMGDDETNSRMERHADELVHSIERGLPVVGYPDVQDLNVAVAYGFERADGELRILWNRYSSPNEPFVNPVSRTGPWISIASQRADAKDRRRAILDSLLSPNWRARELPAHNPNVVASYLLGNAAFDQWIGDLRDADFFLPEQRESLFFVSWFCFDALKDARTHAALFLSRSLSLFDGPARAAFERATAAYRREAEFLGEVFSKGEEFLGPWTGKPMDLWTADMRKREVDILATVRNYESEAAGHIDAALKAVGVCVS